ncbi:MAG: pyruvate dehydrogenase complex dihydrolipoamide acetyltransferase [Rectinema sp.]
MAIEILMPQLGLTMNEGTITEWAKKEGEIVSKGDVLFYVENDKAVIPFEAQSEGVLAKILVKPMQTVPVGTTVGMLAGKGESLQSGAPVRAEDASVAATSVKAQNAPRASTAPASIEVKTPPENPSQEVRAPTSPAIEQPAQIRAQTANFIPSSPYARVIAKERNIALATLQGSGPEGAVVARDIAASSTLPASAQILDTYEDQRLSRVRQIAADRLTKSWAEIPQFTLFIEANAQGLLNAQDVFKSKDEKISITVMLAKLMASALADYPLLNASWLGNGEIRVHKSFNISIAVDSPEGLVVPTLRDCSHRGIRELAVELRALAEKARARTLSPDEMQGGTITISNLGMFGITRFRAIINPPQCAIVSVGAIAKRPVECNSGVAFVPVIEIGLTADHRIVDGASGARFLERFKELIEHPVLALG